MLLLCKNCAHEFEVGQISTNQTCNWCNSTDIEVLTEYSGLRECIRGRDKIIEHIQSTKKVIPFPRRKS